MTIKSEAGKAVVNLSADVNITLQPSRPYVYQHRHVGPARQRRRARREAAREAADNAADAIAVNEIINSDEKVNEGTVVKAAKANDEETELSEPAAIVVGDHRNELCDHSNDAKAEYSCELWI